MVSSNPLFSGKMSIRKKFLATVINDIWPEVLFFTLVATMVTLISEMTTHQLTLKNDLLGVLGTALGLVISFRTSSAYERYQDGRKMWTNIATYSRALATMIWIHVPNDRPERPELKRLTVLESIIEKKTMINLIQAYAVSVKHYLRGEPGVYYQDLYPLISFLPRYASGGQTEADMLPIWHASEDGEHPYEHGQIRSTSSFTSGSVKDEKPKGFLRSLSGHHHRSFDPEQVLPQVNVHRPLKPSRNPPQASLSDYFPFLRIFKLIAKPFRKSPGSQDVDMRSVLGRKHKPSPCDSNVPVEISLFLMNYFNLLIRNSVIQAPLAGVFVGQLGNLQDTLTNLERIANTPLPFAYQAHLRISLWIYLLALPFQIYTNFHYLTIPGTAFAAFLFLGFLEIGQEIENPFNYDLNDLDLDEFCLTIQRELHEITAHPAPNPHDYIFSSLNQPFAPADRRNADELCKAKEGDYIHEAHGPDSQPGMMSINRTLLKAWKDVDTFTRK